MIAATQRYFALVPVPPRGPGDVPQDVPDVLRDVFAGVVDVGEVLAVAGGGLDLSAGRRSCAP
ncbi:hypothetical protein [Nonomuraea sp. NPDC049028]|uniref:hypothetical protein n=1 Tax=Nonomuraea sp. NPDC049028 TaxID=3364348 RepID=UPI003724C2C3